MDTFAPTRFLSHIPLENNLKKFLLVPENTFSMTSENLLKPVTISGIQNLLPSIWLLEVLQVSVIVGWEHDPSGIQTQGPLIAQSKTHPQEHH